MGAHTVVVHDTPDPDTFGVECSCGYREIAFFGRPQVDKIIEDHFRRAGVESKVVIL